MKKSRNHLVRDLILMIVLGLATITMSLAWFYNIKDGDTDTVEIISVEATGFRISVDNINYSTSVTINIPSNVKMIPISGNGIDFYLPKIESGSDQIDSSDTWVKVEYDDNAAVNYFYKKTIYFRAISPGYIKLEDISVTPIASGNELYSSQLSDIVRPVVNSLYTTYDFSNGYLSKDYIVASTRVYFKTEQSTNNLLYIPYDNVSINLSDNGSGKRLITLNSNATPVTIENSKFYNGSYIDYYSSLSGVNFYRDSEVNSPLTITELKQDTLIAGEDKYQSSIDFYIWIEGYDNEAISCLADGMFNISMRFTFEKKVSN